MTSHSVARVLGHLKRVIEGQVDTLSIPISDQRTNSELLETFDLWLFSLETLGILFGTANSRKPRDGVKTALLSQLM